MKIKNLLLVCSLFLAGGVVATSGEQANNVREVAAEVQTLTIDKSAFNSKSYADNNNEKTATGSDGKVYTYYSNQVMLQSSAMQWQKNKGYIYNKTELAGNITKISLNGKSSGTFTIYSSTSIITSTSGLSGKSGNEYEPSNSTDRYFYIKVGNATGKLESITVTYDVPTVAATLTGLEIETDESANYTYKFGESLSLDGFKVIASYDDATSKDVTYHVQWSLVDEDGNSVDVNDGYEFASIGTYTLRASYEGMTADYANVVVNDIKVSSMTINSSKNLYYVGETIDLSTISGTLNYEDGSTLPIDVNDLVFSPSTFNEKGNVTVVVTHKLFSEVSSSFDVSVEVALIDTLTATGFGITSTNSYKVFSDVAFSTDARYSGFVAKGAESNAGAIQMNNKSSNSDGNKYYGLYNSQSAGLLKKIVVDFTESTASERTVNIVASNTAFANVQALYSADVIGTIINNGDDTVEFVFADDYEYFGLYSKSGALYMNSVSVFWEEIEGNDPVTSVAIGDNFTIGKNGTKQLTATVEPSTAADKTVTWSSTNENVATVEDGLVTALTAGTTTIKAVSNENNSIYDECVVTVVAEPAPQEKTISELLTMEVNKNNTYLVSGKITEIKNTSYGNFYITDGTDSILVYGASFEESRLSWNANSVAYEYSSQKDFDSSKVAVDDVVEMRVILDQYNGTNQLKGIITKVIPAVADSFMSLKVGAALSMSYSTDGESYSDFANLALMLRLQCDYSDYGDNLTSTGLYLTTNLDSVNDFVAGETYSGRAFEDTEKDGQFVIRVEAGEAVASVLDTQLYVCGYVVIDGVTYITNPQQLSFRDMFVKAYADNEIAQAAYAYWTNAQ